MAQVTVQQLAEVVGASVERLLTQMKEAGLPHGEAEQAVSDEDKQTLLAYLKRSHGESTEAPKRITLKRKKLSTLRTSGSQGKKTVNVEVRKKRTYVKRDPADLVAEATATDDQELLAQEAAVEDVTASEAEEAAPAPVAEAPAVEVKPAEPEYEIEPEPEEDLANLDPEILRQRAAQRRMAKEAEEAAARQAAIAARKAEDERQKQEILEQGKDKSGDKAKAADTVKRPKRLHEAPATSAAEEQRRKQRGKLGRNAPAGRGKQRGHNLSLSDLDAAESGLSRRRGGRKRIKATHEEHSKHGFEMPT
ncbi:MAG: translation initiation factor IF-2 associated domain-containing protein, partial [Gammaproteobacteria bacterium]|nr:translation initiation factor IF-2 associated domain-containing protein [Gammaproteobacteria bacterium]